jgi:two-component system chemotaxis response regulator CheY
VIALPAQESAQQRPFRDVAALVVDDQPMLTELIAVMLRRIGFTAIDTASDVETAWSLLRQGSYGLIVSDLHMQPMSGLHLLERVRGDADLRHTPFLMTTASLNTASAVAARDAGVNTYLLKPFTPDLLRAKVLATLAAS